MKRRLVPVLVVLSFLALAPAAWAGPPPPAGPQYQFHPPTSGATVHGRRILWANGSATTIVEAERDADHLGFYARIDPCEGPATVEVRVDGEHVLTQPVANHGLYILPGRWEAGPHHLSFRYTNDLVTDRCDRNLKLGSANISDSYVGSAQAWQQMALDQTTIRPVTAGRHVTRLWADTGAVALWSNGSLHGVHDSQGGTPLQLNYVGWACGEEPRLAVRVDGETVYTSPVRRGTGESLHTVQTDQRFADGLHEIEVEYLNDRDTPDCEMSVLVRDLSFTGHVQLSP